MTSPISAGRSARSKTEAGFTLLEMLVVLAILGAALALIAARGPLRSPGLEVREATSMLAQTLRLGRGRAIASDRPVAVALDLADHRLLVDGALQAVLPPSVALVAATADGSAARGQAIFVFAPDGSATGGEVGLDGGGRRSAVTVDWLSGRIGVLAR